jgi:hypothetical protein
MKIKFRTRKFLCQGNVRSLPGLISRADGRYALSFAALPRDRLFPLASESEQMKSLSLGEELGDGALLVSHQRL